MSAVYKSEWGGFPWTGYLVPLRVCLPVAVEHGGCWLVAVGGGGAVIPRFFRLTFRPRFAKSRNCLRIQTLENGLQFYNTPFCREFRCASCWHSHLIRLSTFRKKSRKASNQWKSIKIIRYMLKKSRTCFFCGCRTAGGRSPPVAQLRGITTSGGPRNRLQMLIISRDWR